MKTCTICKKKLPVNSFSPQSKDGSKFHTHCKECRKKHLKEHRKLFPDTYRGYEYKKKYKITLDIYNQVLEKQNGVCAICKGTWSRPLVVDHDHDCCPGEYTCGNCLRALLCNNCNSGLGWFKHNPEIMKAAIKYILKIKPRAWP